MILKWNKWGLKKYRNSNSNSSTPQEFNLHLDQRSGSARPSASPAQRPRPAHFQLAASSVAGAPVTSTPLASPAVGEQSSPHRRQLPTPQTGGWSVAPSPAAFLGDLNAGGGSPPNGSPVESTGAVDMRQEFILFVHVGGFLREVKGTRPSDGLSCGWRHVLIGLGLNKRRGWF
jgi:hypothetical protein